MRRERAASVDNLRTDIIPASFKANQVESFSAMASIAVAAETSPVDIILLVAAAAGRRQADLSFHRDTVAGDAAEALMCTIQHIVCLFVVIECP